MGTKFRSGFEADFARDLYDRNIKASYETNKIRYVPPVRTYTPDFFIEDHDFYVETKGLFSSEDRAKHLLIQKQHPDLDIRFIFMNSKKRLSKKSKTTYAQWCDKHGFKYDVMRLPEGWMND